MPLSYAGNTTLSWVPTVFCALVVGVRLFVRTKLQSLGIDDGLVFLAWLCQAFVSIFWQTTLFTDVFVPDYNLGRYTAEHCLASVFGSLGLFFGKSGVAVLLVRLIGPTSRWTRNIIIVTVCILALATILEIIVVIVPPCSQAPSTWPVQQCIPNEQLARGFIQFWNFYSATFDVLYSILPVSFIYQLNMSRRKKALILCSLSMGWTAAVFSLLRAISYYVWSDSDYANIIIHVSSTLELALVIICASLPVLMKLYDSLKRGKPLRRQDRDPNSFTFHPKHGQGLVALKSKDKLHSETSRDGLLPTLQVERTVDIDQTSVHVLVA